MFLHWLWYYLNTLSISPELTGTCGVCWTSSPLCNLLDHILSFRYFPVVWGCASLLSSPSHHHEDQCVLSINWNAGTGMHIQDGVSDFCRLLGKSLHISHTAVTAVEGIGLLISMWTFVIHTVYANLVKIIQLNKVKKHRVDGQISCRLCSTEIFAHLGFLFLYLLHQTCEMNRSQRTCRLCLSMYTLVDMLTPSLCPAGYSWENVCSPVEVMQT